MYRVKLYKGNEAGEIAYKLLMKHPNVEVVDVIDQQGDFLQMECDIIFSASYPYRITEEMCSVAKMGAVNIHTGLLPEGRGVAPLNWAIIWGKEHAGVTIHKIVDSFDAGDVCMQLALEIGDNNIIELKDRIMQLYEPMIQAFFDDPEIYMDNAWMQNQANVTYAPKRRPEDSELNLKAASTEIYNLWRACDPDKYPAFVMNRGKKLIVERVTKEGGVLYRDENK